MLAAADIRYKIAERVRAIAPGGIGAIHLLARNVGLIRDIGVDLQLLERRLPYHESSHVLNIADKRGVAGWSYAGDGDRAERAGMVGAGIRPPSGAWRRSEADDLGRGARNRTNFGPGS